MASGFERPVSISDAIQRIDQRRYLLPALQRKFVWNTYQIEVLFDSLLRGYPINSFMFWEVTDETIKSSVRFYEFLKVYRQRYEEENPYFNTVGHPDYFAVIDGQQRLTSIYIGLKGSYGYKLERKHWNNTEDAIPTRCLYLNLKEALPDENERNMYYNFCFLTPAEAESDNRDEPDSHDWFRVEDILRLPKAADLSNFIISQGYHNTPFAHDTLTELRDVIFEKPLINYYLEKSQDIDMVLDVFIRTNSGGIPLSFSDLLMSIVTASWDRLDARKEIQEVVNQVFEIQDKEFEITKDFVLKCCLVLLNENIKFRAKTFNGATVQSFETNWPSIKKAILTGFQLVAGFGLNNHSLRAKNAVIPLIYFIFKKEVSDEILLPHRYQTDKSLMQKWINLSLLKRVFSGQSDTVLIRLRRVLRDAIQKGESEGNVRAVGFPLAGIRAEFESDPAKNLSMDNAFIDELLMTQKDDASCFPILSLLYPHLNFYDQDFHKDHLQPATYFYDRKFEGEVPKDSWPFFENPENWNSILNLQLLNSYLNGTKNDSSLLDWVTSNPIDFETQIIPRDCDLSPVNFKEFIDKRRTLLNSRIKGLV